MEMTEPAKCGRWNPTGEQLKVLADLFNAGLRTPSAEQIQKISTHLGSLGKIESKNVFYWFQNHKARERHHYSHKKRCRRPSPALLTAALNDADPLFSANPSDDRTEFQINEELKSKGTEKKTLELFPLTSTSSSSSSSSFFSSSSGYYGYRVVNAGAEKNKSAAVRWNSSLRELRFLDATIDPPLELTLGFF